MSEFYPSSIEDRDIHHKPEEISYSYDQIHSLVKHGADLLEITGFKPDYIVAIGGGGFIPARILRTYVDVPILAVTVSFYEGESHTPTKEPEIIQTIDREILRGKKILIVDEVDDTRSTLYWVIRNLSEKLDNSCDCGVFVVNNKHKEKVIDLNSFIGDMPYIACETTDDIWIKYPWDHV